VREEPTGDPLAELLSSPLDEERPRHGRRAWLVFGAVLLTAALAGTGITLWLTRDSGENDPGTTAVAAGSTTTTGVTNSSTTTAAPEGTTTTTAAAPVAGTPDPRVYAQLVATDAGLFLFGGLKPVQRLNADRFDDVWRYDLLTGEWWEVLPAGGPMPRAGAAAAYDAGSGLVVFFGGAVGSCNYPACADNLDDTWVYDPVANTWEERSPDASPPARHAHAMAYDARSDRVVLFGGDTGSAWLDDTWAYDTDADTWVEITTAEAPLPVAQQAMAYDPTADRVVLWGGADREESTVWALDLETSTWSGGIWDPAPEPAWDACLVWDAAAAQMLLIGGEGLTRVQISAEITAREVRWRDEVWALDVEAGAWALLGHLPGPVAQHGCADDPEGTGVFIWSNGALLPVDPATGTGMAEG
jgi:N-acetylneuraminic acid mutarotase